VKTGKLQKFLLLAMSRRLTILAKALEARASRISRWSTSSFVKDGGSRRPMRIRTQDPPAHWLEYIGKKAPHLLRGELRTFGLGGELPGPGTKTREASEHVPIEMGVKSSQKRVERVAPHLGQPSPKQSSRARSILTEFRQGRSASKFSEAENVPPVSFGEAASEPNVKRTNFWGFGGTGYVRDFFKAAISTIGTLARRDPLRGQSAPTWKATNDINRRDRSLRATTMSRSHRVLTRDGETKVTCGMSSRPSEPGLAAEPPKSMKAGNLQRNPGEEAKLGKIDLNFMATTDTDGSSSVEISRDATYFPSAAEVTPEWNSFAGPSAGAATGDVIAIPSVPKPERFEGFGDRFELTLPTPDRWPTLPDTTSDIEELHRELMWEFAMERDRRRELSAEQEGAAWSA
jgi:hypothetical protein